MWRINTQKLLSGDIVLWSICGIVASIPFAINLGNLALILAALISLKNVRGFERQLLFKPTFYFPLLLLGLYTFSGLLSDNFSAGIAKLDRQLLIGLIIFIFSLYQARRDDLVKILKVFIISVAIASSWLLLIAVFRVFNGYPTSEIIFHGFTQPLDQHPVYFSLYLGLAIIITLFHDKISSEFNLWLRIILLQVLVIALILAASKAVIVGVLLMAGISAIVRFRKSKAWLAVVLGLVTILVAVSVTPELSDRFTKGLNFSEKIYDFQPSEDFLVKKQFTLHEKKEISDLELRVLLAKISIFHLVNDGKLWFGYGVGDSQDHLNYQYFSYNLGPNWYEDFNLHNQYLEFLTGNGFWFTLIFISYLAYGFRMAWYHRDLIYMNFLVLIVFVFLFESLLVRNKGIIFFYFFNTLFLLKYIYFENRDTRN